jgi:hypothetical protein
MEGLGCHWVAKESSLTRDRGPRLAVQMGLRSVGQGLLLAQEESPQSLATTPPIRIEEPSRPRGGGASTSQGHSVSIFRRAIERGNLTVAEATAREILRISLTDALELTVLIARKGSRRDVPHACRDSARAHLNRDPACAPSPTS